MDERFLRNEMLWGKDGQARLTAAHVIVITQQKNPCYRCDP